MLKTTILASILAFASCAKLDHLYLPPNLAVLQKETVAIASNQYLPPNQAAFQKEAVQVPSNQYLPSSKSISQDGGVFGIHSNGGLNAQAYSSVSQQIPILKYAAENNGETYRYNYETANHINAEEQGEARGDGTKAHGSYSYISPEGEHISISYTADENGFVPQGAHLPTPPPIPEAILKALQENSAAEARGLFDDGQYRGEGLEEGQYKGEGAGQNNGGYVSNNNGYKY